MRKKRQKVAKTIEVEEAAEAGDNRSFVLAALSVLITVILFIPIAAAVFSHFNLAPDLVGLLSKYTFDLSQVKPEPGERAAFIAALLFIPPSILGCFNYLNSRTWSLSLLRRLNVGMALIFLAALIFGAGRDILGGDSTLGYAFLVSRSSWGQHPVLSFLFLLLCAGAMGTFRSRKVESIWEIELQKKAPRLLVGFVFLFCLFNESDPVILADHIHAALYATVQVVNGKTLLADFNHQYGLYPHFLKPIYSLIGLSIFKFSLVMGALLAVSFWLQLAVLEKAVKNLTIRCLGFFALIYFNYFNIKVYYAQSFFPDYEPYFQYWPIRIFFPSVLIYLAWRYFNTPERRLYYGIWVLSSVACLWNLDSGVPVFLSWLLSLSFAEAWNAFPSRRLPLRRIVFHMTLGMVILMTVALAYAGAMYLASGRVVDPREMLNFQKVFYLVGFMMLPMKAVHPWNLIILVYLAGLARSIMVWKSQTPDPRSKLIFLVSILGIGLFSYYQGRSHDCNFPTVTYPGIFLMILYADGLWPTLLKRWRFGLEPVLFSTILIFFSSMTLAFWIDFHSPYASITKRLRNIVSPTPSPVENELRLVRKYTVPREEVLMLSDFSPLWHLAATTRAPVFDSMTESFQIADFDRMLEVVVQKRVEKIFLSSHFSTVKQGIEKRKQLVDAVFKNYGFVDQTPSGSLIHLRRK